MKSSADVIFYIPCLDGGGAEKVFVVLANRFAALGLRVLLLLNEKTGVYLNQISPNVRITALEKTNRWSLLFSIISFVRKNNPKAVISGLSIPNRKVAFASLFYPRRITTALTVHHYNAAPHKRNDGGIINKFLYKRVSRVICVSRGIQECFEKNYGLKNAVTIYNPVVTDDLNKKSSERVDIPVEVQKRRGSTLIAVGRLAPVKDYDTLLKAFKEVLKQREVSLLILGVGSEEVRLKNLARELGVADKIWFLGFKDNPFSYMKFADLLVLSSRYEGFGNVLAEAMAVGTPVVSTNCFHGPSEILENGKYGLLVPVGGVSELAQAIISTLNRPTDRKTLITRSEQFSDEKIAKKYLEALSLN